ncbi:hypothetical protein D3C71_2075040 [compost metagenome]
METFNGIEHMIELLIVIVDLQIQPIFFVLKIFKLLVFNFFLRLIISDFIDKLLRCFLL